VVQGSDRKDDKTISTLLAWLQDLHSFPPEKEVAWDWQLFGRGVTAQDAAERFGWSIGVAEEELEMAEEKGALCREESIEGLKFWENWIVDDR
jgi:ESCRT-II complex subunit VPS36